MAEDNHDKALVSFFSDHGLIISFNPFIPSGLFCLTFWTDSFQYKEYPVNFYRYQYLKEIPVLYANCVDPNQTPRSAASDLCLQYFASVLFMGH